MNNMIWMNNNTTLKDHESVNEPHDITDVTGSPEILPYKVLWNKDTSEYIFIKKIGVGKEIDPPQDSDPLTSLPKCKHGGIKSDSSYGHVLDEAFLMSTFLYKLTFFPKTCSRLPWNSPIQKCLSPRFKNPDLNVFQVKYYTV